MESFTTRNIGCAALRVGRQEPVSGALYLFSISMCIVLTACAAERPPLVTETEQPWQLEYEAQAGVGVGAPLPPRTRAAEVRESAQIAESGEEQHELEESAGQLIAGVFADVIAFPFRGLGWVVQQIF